jgi:hypothetical protein
LKEILLFEEKQNWASCERLDVKGSTLAKQNLIKGSTVGGKFCNLRAARARERNASRGRARTM